MKEFELTLGNTTYKCESSHSDINNRNWIVSAKINDIRLSINIPIESKLSRSKCMLFVESFHEALTAAMEALRENLAFPTQLT